MSDESETGFWSHSPALCLSCGHRWIAVYPTGLPITFECSLCGKMDGVRDD